MERYSSLVCPQFKVVPPGYGLGSTLLNMYINDMPKILKNKVILYAGDSKLICHADMMENIM